MRLLTAHSYDYWPLAKITIQNKIECAGRHGLEIIVEHHVNKRLSWERVEHWERWLPGSEWLLFLACDIALTNPLIDPHSLIDEDYDFIIACDGNGLQSDAWLMKDCQVCRNLLDRVASWEGLGTHEQDALYFELAGISRPLTRIGAVTGPFPLWSQLDFHKYQKSGWYCNPEQTAAAQRELNRSPVQVKVVPQRTINAYPVEYYGQNPADWSWHPGDFACHFVARSLEDRCIYLNRILQGEN